MFLTLEQFLNEEYKTVYEEKRRYSFKVLKAFIRDMLPKYKKDEILGVFFSNPYDSDTITLIERQAGDWGFTTFEYDKSNDSLKTVTVGTLKTPEKMQEEIHKYDRHMPHVDYRG